MRRSRAELAAQLMRAARGAGLPLALAEDLYTAAPFLDAGGIAWIAEDLAAGGPGLAQMVVRLDAAETGGAIEPSGPSAAVAAGRGWVLEEGRKVDGQPAPLGPLDIPDALWSALDGFAARTYVPETESSRAQGAGAGDIDND